MSATSEVSEVSYKPEQPGKEQPPQVQSISCQCWILWALRQWVRIRVPHFARSSGVGPWLPSADCGVWTQHLISSEGRLTPGYCNLRQAPRLQKLKACTTRAAGSESGQRASSDSIETAVDLKQATLATDALTACVKTQDALRRISDRGQSVPL
eukprot:363678-Chlamydomonas_euryale.AAC.8